MQHLRSAELLSVSPDRTLKLNGEKNFFGRNDQIVTSEYNDIVAIMQYDHLRELLPLYAQKRELERQEEVTRSRQMAQFPKTIEDWRRLSKNAQLQVAHFLMADEPKRENMRNRTQWAWRQTEPLIQLYKNNVSGDVFPFLQLNMRLMDGD